MDDLISRKAAIEEFEDMVTSVSVYGESAEARYATNARIRFIEKLNNIPTVPAVPLEPLVNWLADYAAPPIKGQLVLYGSCEEAWRSFLLKWMEEQDAAD